MAHSFWPPWQFPNCHTFLVRYYDTIQAGIMPAKSRFTRLDAFTKTVEDARIRTTSGGVVTIASLLVILFLIWGEWSDYRKILVQPELIVDKGRGEDCTCSLKTIR